MVHALKGGRYGTRTQGAVLRVRSEARSTCYDGTLPRCYLVKIRADTPSRELQVVSCLSTQPVAIAQTEKPAQAQIGVRGDTTPA